MDVEFGRNLTVDEVEKLSEFYGTVLVCHLGEDFAGSDVQGGEEVAGPVAFVVVCTSSRCAGKERKDRGGAVEGLYLGLLVDTEHGCGIGWELVQTYEVTDLLDEQRVIRQFELVFEPRLDPESPPNVGHSRLRHPDLLCQTSRRPVSGICG